MKSRKKSRRGLRFAAALLSMGILCLCVAGFVTSQSGLSSAVSLPFGLGTSQADTSLGWNLILVNKDHRIPANYKVDLVELSNGEKVDSRIYPELQSMFDDARADGLALFVREGYRTRKEQEQIMDERVVQYQAQGYSKAEAGKLARDYVAVPDTSEHQLGLSVDINADTSKCSSDAVYNWLAENAWKYGFIKRYPADKVDITGISNEPWHYRYVGKEAAQEMQQSGMCLEEYVKEKETS